MRHVLEGPVSLIPIELIFAPVADKEALVSVVVIISHTNALTPATLRQASPERNVFEGTISLIAIEVINGFPALGKSL